MSKQVEGCPQPDEPIRERAWTAEQEAREAAITLARKHAKAKRQSYYAEPFQPHEWVIDAIMEAATLRQQAAPTRSRCCGHDSDCAVHNMPAMPAGTCDCSLSAPEIFSGTNDALGALTIKKKDDQP